MNITRRTFASLLILAAPFFLLCAAPAQQKASPDTIASSAQYLLYAGTYTTKQNSKGIYAFRFDSTTGKLTPAGLAATTTDPSFVAVHPNGKYLYAVNELADFNGFKAGAVSSFAIDAKTGTLTPLNQVSTHSPGPCFVSLDKTGKYVLVANYDGGSLATFTVQDDGSLSLVAGFVQHSGSSLDKLRQEGPHAHWIGTSPDNRFALAADLGLDDILVYHFDLDHGLLTPNNPPYAKLEPGSGPRHLAFHPNGKFAYVLGEMSTTVTAFSYQPKNASLSPLQTIATLPRDYSGVKEAAEIAVHPSGKFLYASNRGSANSITIFAIHPTKGTLTQVGYVSTQGKRPRGFVIDPTGMFLLAANQDTNSVVVFHIDAATGALSSAGQTAEVPAPVSLAFVTNH
jgi:6-phosphogluconolactonase